MFHRQWQPPQRVPPSSLNATLYGEALISIATSPGRAVRLLVSYNNNNTPRLNLDAGAERSGVVVEKRLAAVAE